MGFINSEGKFNENTWLIDAAMKNTEGNRVRNGYAAYLIQTEDGANCLINSGARTGAQSIYKNLKRLKVWPIQKLILTHSHWDHTQGIIFFREIVKKKNITPIKVLASEKAISYLNNQAYNQCFTPMERYYSEYLNIPEVSLLKDKEKVRLTNDFILEILETPGHMEDHISVYDKQIPTFSSNSLQNRMIYFQILYILQICS